MRVGNESPFAGAGPCFGNRLLQAIPGNHGAQRPCVHEGWPPERSPSLYWAGRYREVPPQCEDGVSS